jgi:general stress protein CsbA
LFLATILVLLVGVASILRGYTDPWLLAVTGTSFVAALGHLVLGSTTEGLL